ncbi:MAG TPA: DNA-binding protein WhiA [Trebonia sp.]|jgi:hypothetical protein
MVVAVCRAELVTLARLAGKLITTGAVSASGEGELVLVLALDEQPVIERVRWLVTELAGRDCSVDYRRVDAAAGQVVITGAVRRLGMRLGLLDGRGRAVRGLPPFVVADPAAQVAAAIWRAALLHQPRFVTRGPVGALEIWCPDIAVALALTGAARRLGVLARTRAPQTHTPRHPTPVAAAGEWVIITEPKRVAALLTAAGAPRGATSWTATAAAVATERAATGQASGHDPAGMLAGHNQQRARQAAQHSIDAARRALDLLADTAPAELAEAARLRLAHPTASLTELAALANPPTTKDTIAGRLRRLTRRLPAADQ